MPRCEKKQQGAASIEFVFVFIVFFILFYGMVTLTFPLILSATYEELSAEGLREAITMRSHQADTKQIEAAVNRVISNTWLPTQWTQVCDGYPGSFFKNNGKIWSVCIGHNNLSSILPKVNLLGFDIVNLPDTLHGEAIISF